jgi:Flp pilus assembly protein TadG
MFGTNRNSRSRAGSFFQFRKLRAFRRQEDGVAAVEFGLVAMPFFALLFAIIETAMVFLASQTLETAVADSGRTILTGQAQTSGWTAEQFKEQVCTQPADDGTRTQRAVFTLFDCNKVIVDVKKYADFSAVDLTRPVDEQGKVKPGAFEPGGPCEVVVARFIYQFPVYVSLVHLADMAGNTRLLVATSVFRNEPFQGASCAP